MLEDFKKQCELLMSYPPVNIFTTDSQTKAERKAEKRCTNLVDQYYSLNSPVNKNIRNLLHDIDSTLVVMENDVCLKDLFMSAGKLQKIYNDRRKEILGIVKTETLLKEYFKGLGKADLFGQLLKCISFNSSVEVAQLKQYFKGI